MKKIIITTAVIFFSMAGIADAAPDSNSIVKDDIEYYIQTDKSVYNLGENVEMLYRVTNLGDEDVTFEFAIQQQTYFEVSDNETRIWGWPKLVNPAGSIFTLHPGEFKEYFKEWDMINDNTGALVIPGNYDVTGVLHYPPSHERYVPVSVQIEIIPPPPTTYYVNAAEGSDNNDGLSLETPFATIQKAIDSAFDGDTVLVADGTYTGPGNRDIDFLGKAITVRSESGPENCIIDCQGSWKDPHRGFYFHKNEDSDSVVEGFTITNGNTGYGGAIYCWGSNPIIRNCVITNNTAKEAGGGICCHSNLTIINCSITGNTAGEEGGAIYCFGYPIIINCTITGNTAEEAGGAIYCYNNPIISNCTISGNSADSGGAIYCQYNGSPEITNCIIWDNLPQQIVRYWGAPTVSYSNVQGGWPGVGNINIDPIFAFSSDGHLMSNSPCIDAGTNSPPGGLPETDLDGIPRPSDGDSDGIAVADMGAYEFNLQGPSIAISATTLFYIQAGQELTSQALLIRNCSGGTLNWEIVEDCNWLVASPTNGISTGDVNEATITVDTNGMEMGYYRSILRVHDPNATNSPRTVTVNLHVSEEIVYVPRQFSTIQEAIEHVQEEGEVVVADGIYTGDGNRNIHFLGKAITVHSKNGPDNCIVDCQGTGDYSHIGFFFGNGEDSNSVLDGFTITKAYTHSDNISGGIFCEYSSPTITNCIITGNRADYWAAGIRIDFGSPIITNCIISNNIGSGISCLYSNPMITNCTITGNRADDGGGIYNSSYSNPTLTNCILWGDLPDELSGDGDVIVSYSNIQDGYEGQGNIDSDPRFVEPSYWADANDPNIVVEPNDPNAVWIDGDYYLLPNSVCIDTGDPNYVAEPNETDLDGNPRIIGGRVDMGAHESNYIQAAMKFTPQMLNCNNKGKYVKAHLTLPEGFLPEDVDVNESAIAEPMGIESEYIKVFGNDDGLVRLEICFDRETFCAQITETGEIEITVIGSLVTGRYFYATDTIKIKPRR